MVVAGAIGAELGHSPVVKVAGAPLGEQAERNLEGVTVDLAVGLPASAVLRFRDPDLRALEDGGLRIGSPVTVALNRIGDPQSPVLFEGEVTALEYEYDARGSTVVARCHDALHRLTRGRRTRSWTLTDDASVARAVLSAAGLVPGTVEGGQLRHAHVAQLDVSDWDFLSARAREAGRVVVLSEGKVHVRARPTAARGTPVPLVVGEGLERLRVRVTGAGQVPMVSAGGWDPATQRAVSGQTRPQGTAARSGVPYAGVQGAKVASPLHDGSAVLATAAETASRAEGLAARLSDVHAELEGLCGGDPRLLPGVPVRIGGTGPAHDGTYVLTRVQHVSDRDGYTTRIECGAGEDRTLRGLVGGAQRAASTGSGNRVLPGVTVGVVTDVKDPTSRGRVKVSFPWLSGEYATDWARVAAPGAGADRGVAWLPEVNDEVLVAFAHGDSRAPYVLGGLWNGRAAPPLGPALVDAGGRTAQRALRSRTGQRLVMSDQVGDTGVTLATGDDALSVTLAGSSTTLTLDSKGAVVVAGARDVTVRSGTRLVLEGRAGVEISGATVAVRATGDVALSGAVIRLN